MSKRELTINESQKRSSYRYKAVRQHKIRVCNCGSDINWTDCTASDWSYCG